VLPTTRAAAVRVVEAACEFARARGTSRFSVCHRAALLPHTDGLFLHTARNVVVRYPEVGFEARDVDEVARELVRAPQDFAVLAAQPGAGSLLAAVAAGLVGGPDFAPCFHLGPAGPQATPQATTGLAVFGATWPTVPPAAGAGLGALPGPWAVILASVWALRHLGETAPAGRLEAAAAAVLADRGAGGDGAAWTAAAVGEALTDALTHAS